MDIHIHILQHRSDNEIQRARSNGHEAGIAFSSGAILNAILGALMSMFVLGAYGQSRAAIELMDCSRNRYQAIYI